jgi:hypothetical protein
MLRAMAELRELRELRELLCRTEDTERGARSTLTVPPQQ